MTVAMDITSLLSTSRTFNRIQGGSKKRALQQAANFIAADYPALDPDDLFRHLVARERLGSTGIGSGVAIPHCRAKNCPSPIGALITLEDAIDFEAIDDSPVDVLFVLLVPEEAQEQHLQILAKLAQAFGNPNNLHTLREANSDQDLYQRAISLFASLS